MKWIFLGLLLELACLSMCLLDCAPKKRKLTLDSISTFLCRKHNGKRENAESLHSEGH